MSKNDVTGDDIKTKVPSEKYRENWDAIFKKSDKSDKEISDKDIDSDSERTYNNYSN